MMPHEDLLADPVFQLNLLLWMAKEQPGEKHVRPFLYELGYEVLSIDEPVPLPDDIVRAIAESGLEVRRSPKPEVVFQRIETKSGLYFEAKANSFGSGSSNAKQARGHLIASGAAFPRIFAPLEDSILCYLVPNGAVGLMADCLGALARELEEKGFQVGTSSIHGLSIEADRLLYFWDDAFSAREKLESKSVVLKEIRGDWNPSPPLLVFSGDDCPSGSSRDLRRRELLESVHRFLLSDVHAASGRLEAVVLLDDLLERSSEGLFEFLGKDARSFMRRVVHEKMFRYIEENGKRKGCDIDLTPATLSFKWASRADRARCFKWLQGIRFDAGRPEIPTFFGLPGEEPI